MVAFSPSSFLAVQEPIDSPAAKLSVANVMSTASAGSGGVSRAMTNRPGVAGLLDRVDDGGAVRRDEDALLALGDGVLDRLDLGVLVAVGLAGGQGELDAVLLGGLLGAVLHGDEERVGGRLDDQRDADIAAAVVTAAG